jgi:hypothetical protein
MKRFLSFTLLIGLLTSCKKDDPVTVPFVQPAMQYLDLHNEEIGFGQAKIIDINTDGTDDFLFITMLVGDPILERDRRQYYACSDIDSRLLNNDDSETPVLKKYDRVSLQHNGFQWFEASGVVLAEKIVPLHGTDSWRGLWQQASHKYLAVQVKKDGLLYHGWIELSFDRILERIILHKAAISTEAGKTVQAE